MDKNVCSLRMSSSMQFLNTLNAPSPDENIQNLYCDGKFLDVMRAHTNISQSNVEE